MTREEIKDLLKFIIRKCDLIINNENYTADDYVQDKVEDIAEICNMVLDGQFCRMENEDVTLTRSCLEKQKEQKSAEWSVEDESFLKVAIAICNRYSHKDIADWLKSLPEKFNIQPKQNGAKRIMIRLTQQWKPSEDQMSDLWLAATMNTVTCKTLKSLHNDLQNYFSL